MKLKHCLLAFALLACLTGCGRDKQSSDSSAKPADNQNMLDVRQGQGRPEQR